MTIKEVLDICPQGEAILSQHLGHCVTCPGANIETLALGAHLHEKDANKIVKELNELCEKGK